MLMVICSGNLRGSLLMNSITPRQAIAIVIATLENEAKLAMKRSRDFSDAGLMISAGQEQGYCDGLWTAIRELESAVNND